jgi:murein DD-endopeptidase MepM/ murein hydrolase activator NlpD
MAQLPRRFARHLSAVLGAAVLQAAAPATAADWTGTWHVLVHYTDTHSGNPEQARWNDRVWVFERKGSKLRWTEYPIVVFSNDSGRFERRQSGQYARVLGAWEPSERQRANIEAGLKINSRGSKKKSLRGSDEEGWHSTARAHAGSASVITYQENWSLAGWQELPVFEQQDVMASARTETLEGVTRYETTAVEEGGNVLRGRYQRDGTREGTFTMRRSGAVGQLEKRNQREIQRAAYERSYGAESRRAASSGVDRIVAETGLYVTKAQHQALVREAIQLGEVGRDPREVSQALLKSLSGEYYGWLEVGAVPAESARYLMPFASTASTASNTSNGSTALTMGYRADGATAADDSRKGRDRFSLVFALPSGSQVLAARAGRVVQAGDRIAVLHEDGTFAAYTPIAAAKVEVGAQLKAGDLLGLSGEPGQPQGDRLAFAVYHMPERGEVRSLPVRFDDGSAEGFVPVAGSRYPGGGPPGAHAAP